MGGLKILVFQEKNNLIYGQILVVKELMYVRIVVLKLKIINSLIVIIIDLPLRLN